ncbi:hypothetical protein V6K52_12800 [Knoellia sp. S7-12]|uniref:hypothetical protein n=1 Tax=Knoellia sp. S7-12 TaxID=3126698 RepID=UPI0033687550
MHTLHIEHPITDYPTWKRAFDGFAQMRADAGVRSHRVAHPVDDDHHIVVDLDFDTAAAAASFREVLRTRVWSRPSASPALAGEPMARVLVVAEHTGRGGE